MFEWQFPLTLTTLVASGGREEERKKEENRRREAPPVHCWSQALQTDESPTDPVKIPGTPRSPSPALLVAAVVGTAAEHEHCRHDH